MLDNGQVGLAIPAGGLTVALVALVSRRRRRVLAQRTEEHPPPPPRRTRPARRVR
jgi:hypothetical protein